jgi:uncharacterized protein YaiE (UPF0345 family)
MSEFKNVTVIKEANVYFEGKVTSRTILFDGGCRKTLGIMLPGSINSIRCPGTINPVGN